MCDKCQNEYTKCEELKKKFELARQNANECKKQADSTTADFSHVIIGGSPIDGDVITNCSRSLMVVTSSLSTLIKQCDEKMMAIKSGCPGPDHYNPKKK